MRDGGRPVAGAATETEPRKGNEMKAEDDAGVMAIVTRWPNQMPMGAAMRLLGVSKATFCTRVKQGLIRYAQDAVGKRRRYDTEHVLMMAGVERPGSRDGKRCPHCGGRL